MTMRTFVTVLEKLNLARGMLVACRMEMVSGKLSYEDSAATTDAIVSLDKVLDLSTPATVDYEAIARAASNDVLRAQRAEFQKKWGNYVKCSKCGGPVPPEGRLRVERWNVVPSPCCDAPVTRNGYTPPPDPA